MRQTASIRTNSLSKASHWNPQTRQLLNVLVTVGSAFLCLLLLPTRFPGMTLLGIAPNWVLIWVVAWSVKRTAFQGAAAGLALGLIQDGMTAPHPTHALSLALAGILTARLQKDRFVQEDFISVSLIVFGMTVVVETLATLQFSLLGYNTLAEIWNRHQLIALSSAILSSLWAPVVYFPLNRWWEQMKNPDSL